MGAVVAVDAGSQRRHVARRLERHAAIVRYRATEDE
jgi:hypothetical protein